MSVRLVRKAVPTALAVLAVVVGVAPGASAHVTVQPGSLPRGASDVIVSFASPNERPPATITRFEVDFPTNQPILSVYVLPLPGWTATVQTVTLAKPVKTDDGPVSQVVSQVVWSTTGPGIGASQFGLFSVLAGALPTGSATLVFKALQTYSDGQVVRWIQPIVKGAPQPDNPTPVLKLTKK